jgi:predicted Rossmann fold flavoprotein
VIAIVGAGAAGIATAIFAARRGVRGPIVVLDGAARPGAKILVSGGSRCNVTNARVSEADFAGSAPHLIRRVLRALRVEDTVAFFRQIGVGLHEEEHGKLFPDTNRSRSVLEALLAESRRRGVELRAGTRVEAVEPEGCGFALHTRGGRLVARRVVLATGGLSLPKTGSDGQGLEIAAGLGHSLVPTTPALVPLTLDGGFHRPLSGVSLEATLTVRAAGRVLARRTGSLLFTHFGVSGPVVLDVSRSWLRARSEGLAAVVEASLVPGATPESLEREILAASASGQRQRVGRLLAGRLPEAVAAATCDERGLPRELTAARLRREDRRALALALTRRVLPVTGSRGYAHAEVTAGGVPLAELDTRTMESRRRPGLFLVGEMLDVDGRIGGFNFQWAWSSAWVAAGGLARAALW